MRQHSRFVISRRGNRLTDRTQAVVDQAVVRGPRYGDDPKAGVGRVDEQGSSLIPVARYGIAIAVL